MTLKDLLDRINEVPLKDQAYAWLLQQGEGFVSGVLHGQLIKALAQAEPAVVGRMQQDGWTLQGRPDHGQDQEQAIRSAIYLLFEQVLEDSGIVRGANVPADMLRDQVDHTVVKIVEPQLSTASGSDLHGLVSLTSNAIVQVSATVLSPTA